MLLIMESDASCEELVFTDGFVDLTYSSLRLVMTMPDVPALSIAIQLHYISSGVIASASSRTDLNKSVDRYRSPQLGRIATILFPDGIIIRSNRNQDQQLTTIGLTKP